MDSTRHDQQHPPGRDYDFDAFISYARIPDKELARALHRRLLRMGRPPWRRSPRRIFLDRENIDPGRSLPEVVRAALASTRFLILLASAPAGEHDTGSAGSGWVADELGWWLGHGGTVDRLLIVNTRGPVWTGVPAAWQETLRELNPACRELQAAHNSGRPIDQRHYDRDVATLLARIDDRPVADIIGAETEYEARRVRVRRRVIAGLTVLTMFAVAGGIVATLQAIVATHERTKAVRQRDRVASQAAAGEAEALRPTDPAVAMQVTAAAYQVSPTPEAAATLLSSFASVYDTRLTGHREQLAALAFTADGRTLFSADTSGILRAWAVRGAHSARSLGSPVRLGPSRVSSLALSPDGHLLAAASTFDVRLWSVRDPGRPVALGRVPFGPGRLVTTVRFDPLGRFLAVGALDGELSRWNVARPGTPTRIDAVPAHRGVVSAIAISADGRELATGGDDDRLVLWDTGDPTRIVPLAERTGFGGVNTLSFAPDGSRLAVGGGDRLVHLFGVGEGTGLGPRPEDLALARDVITGAAFSPDGRALVAVGFDHQAAVWDVSAAPARPMLVLPHPFVVRAVALAPTGLVVATGDADGVVRLWDPREPVLANQGTAVTGVAADAAGDLLAASGSTEVRLWRRAGSAPPALAGVLTGSGADGSIEGVAMSPDGRLVAARTSRRTVLLWDLGGPGRRAVRIGPSTATAITFAPDGRLVTGQADGSVQVWDVAAGSAPAPGGPPIAAPPFGAVVPVRSLAVSADGTLLATGRDLGLVLVQRLDTGGLVSFARGHSDTVSSLAFGGPGGHRLVSGSLDRTVRVWDAGAPGPTLTQLRQLTGHTAQVRAVSFGPRPDEVVGAGDDGMLLLWDLGRPVGQERRLRLRANTLGINGLVVAAGTVVTGSDDGHPRLWTTDLAAALHRVCVVVGSRLTRAEWSHYFPPEIPFRPVCEQRRS